MNLNASELEILRDAAMIRRRPDQGHNDAGWFKPMHVGGTDASPHSRLLRGMAKRGLVEKRRWGRAFAYRITQAGIDAVSAAKRTARD